MCNSDKSTTNNFSSYKKGIRDDPLSPAMFFNIFVNYLFGELQNVDNSPINLNFSTNVNLIRRFTKDAI